MEENFGKMHMEDETMKKKGASLKDLANGYPDMGNGRYAEKLSYKEWYDFNRVQRVHKNFLESLTVIVVLILINGIANPISSIVLGGAYFLVRLFLCTQDGSYWGYFPALIITLILMFGSIRSIA